MMLNSTEQSMTTEACNFTGPTLLETAELAYELSSQRWSELNTDTTSTVTSGAPDRKNRGKRIDEYTENILSLLLIRILAILQAREDTPNLPHFRDLSAITISRTIIAHETKNRRKSIGTDVEDRAPALEWPETITNVLIYQLKTYISKILGMYRGVFYHSCHHAHHVFLSANKLLDSLLCEHQWLPLDRYRTLSRRRSSFIGSIESRNSKNDSLEDDAKNDIKLQKLQELAILDPTPKRKKATYGIKSDPLIQFAYLFSALVHDVDHQGLSNRQLVLESDEIAIMYNDQSVQEQRSLAIAFTLLMKSNCKVLTKALFRKQQEFLSFRSNVINLVLCTDISSPERVQILKSKWSEAFGDSKRNLFDAYDEIDSTTSGTKIESDRDDSKLAYDDPEIGEQRKVTIDLEGKEDSCLGGKVDNFLSMMSKSRRDDLLANLNLSDDETSEYSLGIRKALDRTGAVIEVYGNNDDLEDTDPDSPNPLKAVVILELMLNTADVGANMQKWETMLKWSENLFDELKTSFIAGRGTDPASGWHGHQIAFFDSYVLPLTSSITALDILDRDVSTQLHYHVLNNHIRWKREGMKFVNKMVHPWTQLPVGFFSLHDPQTAEEKSENYESLRNLLAQMRVERSRQSIKIPMNITIRSDSKYNMTLSQKYNHVAETLSDIDRGSVSHIDGETISGLRYLLACYVMFMYIGSNESWGCFANLRGMRWHEHIFFLLGGYAMALPMNPVIVAKFNYSISRIKAMYPVYLIAVVLAIANLLVVCRPSTFRNTFHWGAQPYDLLNSNGDVAPLFCEGTPAIPTSYWGSLFTTIIISIAGLAVTPFWPLSWVLGYSFWFNSVYYQCLGLFPLIYNAFFRARKRKGLLLKIIAGLILLSYAIVLVPWFTVRHLEVHTHYINENVQSATESYNNESSNDRDRTATLNSSQDCDNPTVNIWILHFFLFGPFWIVYFVMGVCLAFMYDAFQPANKHKKMWGYIADSCTLIMIVISIVVICQGNSEHPEDTMFMRPAEADNNQFDNKLVVRLWDTIAARLACPLTMLWVYTLSTGEGFTAKVLRGNFLIKYLSPNAYSCFLFHQIVSQWYFAATRNGHWWNYWRYRETFYWYSPEPCPVEWYEYPLLVGLTTFFSQQIHDLVLPIVRDSYRGIRRFVQREKKEEELLDV